ncbi:hypothetical protein BB14905_08413 [Bacillus sp. B14905]|nr:hypothetical protein BB14905_08413 [Bacillus sp. B14905]
MEGVKRLFSIYFYILTMNSVKLTMEPADYTMITYCLVF